MFVMYLSNVIRFFHFLAGTYIRKFKQTSMCAEFTSRFICSHCKTSSDFCCIQYNDKIRYKVSTSPIVASYNYQVTLTVGHSM